jgi:EAL domain-containing protein (putative c-di-GMP-specific phosphodiesterase class I)/DNA-binding NarL/FixJ family response regulator
MNISQLKVMVVEDESFQRKLIVDMLKSLGVANIIEAVDGKQALASVRDKQAAPPDFIICDLNMPEIDGLEFMRHLSKETFQPSVVIASALEDKLLSSADLMAKTYGIRLLGTLQKPVTLNNLKQLVSKQVVVEKKWESGNTAKTFSLEEVLQGLRNNQFEPFFQPKVDIKTGRLIGAEALARWAHPEFGVIAPHAFIPLLEKAGQIDVLTFDMLKKSAAACREFHQSGHILTISVNLSLASLADIEMSNQIINLVKEAGIDPNYIILEITESAAMTNAGHALENLTRLCMNGFVLSIDDYGTGYSSMQQLTRIAFGELKIDQSFVTDLASNAALRIVVESSIEMAHKLQVKSVAEGVETQQDWDLLAGAGCDTAQGYFISKPLSQADFAKFMASFKLQVSTPIPEQAASRPNILVVDDDSFARGIIVRVLRALGYEKVKDTDSPVNALKLLESQTFDLIITDVDMPGMNGLEFAHMIRSGKTHTKANTRILVLTSYSNTELLGVGMALDVNGFMVKPLIPAVLDEKITQAMSEKLHLRSPLAYQSVMTELQSMKTKLAVPAEHKGTAVVIPHKPPQTQGHEHRVALRWLRPGMVLNENIYAKDGTMMMKAKHVLTETSINRINDLSGFLKETSFAVEEAKSTS